VPAAACGVSPLWIAAANNTNNSANNNGRITKGAKALQPVPPTPSGRTGLGISSLIRHSSFVIRHSPFLARTA